MTEIVVPAVGESISEVQISQWLKKEGEWVSAGTDLVDLETEKASVQVSAPVDGYLVKILKPNDQFATVGEVIAEFQPSAKGAAASTGATGPAGSSAPVGSSAPTASVSAPAATAPAEGSPRVMPAAKRMMEDQNVSLNEVTATGPGGRVLKEDVARAASATPASAAPASAAPIAKPAATSGALEPASRPVPTAVTTTTVSPPGNSHPRPRP